MIVNYNCKTFVVQATDVIIYDRNIFMIQATDSQESLLWILSNFVLLLKSNKPSPADPIKIFLCKFTHYFGKLDHFIALEKIVSNDEMV
jgi:hypothetical protein